MDFATRMETRRSCRAYQDRPVAREDLLKMVQAGRLTPSGCNSQPWKFIVVDEPQARAGVCEALVVDTGTGAPWRHQVPAFIVLCEMQARVMKMVSDHYGTTQRFAQGDLGAAAMNMCHQAMDLGLSTCIIGVNDQEKMEQCLGIPAGHEVRLVIAVGYGAEEEPYPKKIRKSLEEVCSFNHW